jgi:transposase
MRAYGYLPHVRSRGQQVSAQESDPQHKTRRWVVERTHSWLNRFRKILVRFEKKAASYEALLELACALIVFRQIIPIYG